MQLNTLKKIVLYLLLTIKSFGTSTDQQNLKNRNQLNQKQKEEKQAQLDKKLGRFFEDQPDVTDDYQVHFIYLLTLDGKDTELDISGWIEKRIKK